MSNEVFEYIAETRGERNERQRCLDILTLTPSEIRLMAGEMTAQEMRTVQAILGGLKRKIQRGR